MFLLIDFGVPTILLANVPIKIAQSNCCEDAVQKGANQLAQTLGQTRTVRFLLTYCIFQLRKIQNEKRRQIKSGT
jgi:hypothetical protein